MEKFIGQKKNSFNESTIVCIFKSNNSDGETIFYVSPVTLGIVER